MDICFEGVGQVAATFQLDGGDVQPGMAVTLAGNGTVGLGEDGDLPCGVVLGGVRDGAAAVQIGGVAKVGCSGTGLAAGWRELVCDGSGGVRAVDGGVKAANDDDEAADDEEETAGGGVMCLVLAVDEDGKSAVIRL